MVTTSSNGKQSVKVEVRKKEGKYPVGEEVWVRYLNRMGDTVSIITSKPSREWYYLYDLVDGEYIKRGKDKNPSALVDRFGVKERMFA